MTMLPRVGMAAVPLRWGGVRSSLAGIGRRVYGRAPPHPSRADANAPPVERDDIPELKLPPTPPIHLAVHRDEPVDDRFLHVSPGVEKPSELEKLAETDRVAADGDVVDRGGGGHGSM